MRTRSRKLRHLLFVLLLGGGVPAADGFLLSGLHDGRKVSYHFCQMPPMIMTTIQM